MLTIPKIEYQPGRHYVAIRSKVSMEDIPKVLPHLIPEVINWLKENGRPAEGIAFFHYKAMDNNNRRKIF